jgi:hypothetical protein
VGATSDNIGIDLMSASGGSVVSNISQSAKNNGQYLWTIPTSLLAGQYRLRVCVLSSGGNTCGNADMSDSAFTLVAANPSATSITVTYPNGGETLSSPLSATITWQTSNLPLSSLGSVKIGVRNKTTGAPYYMLYSTPNDGSQNVSFSGIPQGSYQLFISSIDSSYLPVYGWGGTVNLGTVTTNYSSDSLTASTLAAIKAALDAIQSIILNQLMR